MTGLDKGFSGSGEPRPEPGAGPFFPGPGANRGTVPPPRGPLPAPPAVAPATGPATGGSAVTSGANALPMTLHGTPGDITTAVDGRITIENGVIGKIAALAALEVDGVAALVPRPGGAGGPDAPGGAGAARTRAGVRVDLDEDADEVTLDVAIAVEYGTVIKDVAKLVKANVARVAGLMLGMRITAVNVSVEDVHAPGGQAAARA
ncbi:Asp23/Gls24 family envelope stress response protein [Spirillospora sp. NBC_00431]